MLKYIGLFLVIFFNKKQKIHGEMLSINFSFYNIKIQTITKDPIECFLFNLLAAMLVILFLKYKTCIHRSSRSEAWAVQILGVP